MALLLLDMHGAEHILNSSAIEMGAIDQDGTIVA
jgi:hypothetical protein